MPVLRSGWLILLSAAAMTYVMAWHATMSYWRMAGELGYDRSFPDAQGCKPLTGQETPSWVLFFSLWMWQFTSLVIV